ncbi:MAG: hypothetical protein K1X79_10455, partial [Oligoflexia bacterium]|nr:hypothetical protein [Oligoflexia bacterium]
MSKVCLCESLQRSESQAAPLTVAAVGWALLVTLAFFSSLLLGEQAAFAQSQRCARLVSLAPSLTETSFELGLGPRLVGVSLFSDYPVE